MKGKGVIGVILIAFLLVVSSFQLSIGPQGLKMTFGNGQSQSQPQPPALPPATPTRETFPLALYVPGDEGYTTVSESEQAAKNVATIVAAQLKQQPTQQQTAQQTSNNTVASLESLRFIWPITGRITLRFHEIYNDAVHQGIDIACNKDAVIVAPADGIVEYMGPRNGGGDQCLILNHGMLSNGLSVFTQMLHMNAALVPRNQSVKQGQPVAKCGTKGNSTGYHLHFEIRLSRGFSQGASGGWSADGGPVDPLKYLP